MCSSNLGSGIMFTLLTIKRIIKNLSTSSLKSKWKRTTPSISIKEVILDKV